MPNKRIFITGGHVTPALAVIGEIKKQNKPWEIIFIGRKTALEGERAISEEYRLMREAGIRFLPLYTGRILRTVTGRGLLSVLKVPLGFVMALGYVLYYRPQVVLTFGGYVSAPVALAAGLMGIPVIVHEQTSELGFANKLISRFSKKILASNPELLKKLPPGKSVYTGLPVRDNLFRPPKEPTFKYDRRFPLIYITGGTTGALSLNDLIFPLIPQLCERFMIVHQTGRQSFGKALMLAESLTEKTRLHYLAAPYFDSPDVAWLYGKALVVIGRAGANTTAEIALLGKTAVLVPLPWSAGHEQQENADRLVRAGSAVVVDQNKIDSKKFSEVLKKFFEKRAGYELRAKDLAGTLLRDGAARVVGEIEEFLA